MLDILGAYEEKLKVEALLERGRADNVDCLHIQIPSGFFSDFIYSSYLRRKKRQFQE